MAIKQRILCLAPGRAAPGMVLARPVADREGSMLLSAGTVLGPPMLERLIRRGVDAVTVLVPDGRDEATIARELAAVRNRVETIFRGPSNPAREELRAAVEAFRIEITQ